MNLQLKKLAMLYPKLSMNINLENQRMITATTMVSDDLDNWTGMLRLESCSQINTNVLPGRKKPLPDSTMVFEAHA